jgi:hypothetical protein
MVTPKKQSLGHSKVRTTKSFCSPNFGGLFSVSGGYYNKQEPTHGGYQDVLKIHNHGSQRIEEPSKWYKKPLVLS